MRPTMFDHFQLKAAAVFSYDIPTPQIGQGGAEAAILTGDMAHLALDTHGKDAIARKYGKHVLPVHRC